MNQKTKTMKIYKITLNWQGEDHKYYRLAFTEEQALRFAIRELARGAGYNTWYMRNYILDNKHHRWEVEEESNG